MFFRDVKRKNKFFPFFPALPKGKDDKPGRQGLHHKEVPGVAPAQGRHAARMRRKRNRITDNGFRMNGGYGVSRIPGVLLIFRTDMDGVSGTTSASSSDSSS